MGPKTMSLNSCILRTVGILLTSAHTQSKTTTTYIPLAFATRVLGSTEDSVHFSHGDMLPCLE